ncbi:MAG: hypothetical protein ACYTDY_11210 [Planctomycetota bacterium]
MPRLSSSIVVSTLVLAALLAADITSWGQEPPARGSSGMVEVRVADLLQGRATRVGQRPVSGGPIPSGSYGFSEDEDLNSGPFAPNSVSDESRSSPLLSEGNLSEVLAVLGVPEEIDTSGGEATGLIRVPASVADKVAVALARLRAQRVASVDLEFAIEILEPDGRTTLLSAREPIPVGETTVFADAREKPYLSDHDVEIAEASEIPDPIAWFQRTGTCLSVRVRPLARADAAIVEARARVAEPLDLPPIDLRHPDFGSLDRGGVGIEEACVAFRVDRGKRVEHVWTGRSGRKIRLRLKAGWRRPPADSGVGAVLWTRLASTYIHGFHRVPWTGRAANDEQDESWPEWGTVDYGEIDFDARAERALEGKVASLAVRTQSGLFVLGGEHADAARDDLASRLDRALHSAEVDIVAYEVPAGVTVDAAGKMPTGGREMLRVSGRVLPGLSACFVGSEEQNYVQDWDVEVAQAALIPDPIVMTVESGHYVNVRLLPGPGEKPKEILLDLQLLRLLGIETKVLPVKIPRGRVRIAGSSSGKGGTSSGTLLDPRTPPPERAQFVLERPTLRELRVSAALPLDANGQVRLRRGARGFLGPAREMVVLVTVK